MVNREYTEYNHGYYILLRGGGIDTIDLGDISR